MTHAYFIEAVARLTKDVPEAKAIHRDASDWLREPWGTGARAVEVLTESIRVLVAEHIEDVLVGGLVALCVEAVASRIIIDPHHAEFFAGVHPARN